MTLLPSLADVIRETLPADVISEFVRKCDAYFRMRKEPPAIGAAREYLLSALLPTLSAREQTLKAKLALAEGLACDQRDYAVMLEAAEARVSALTAEREALTAEIVDRRARAEKYLDHPNGSTGAYAVVGLCDALLALAGSAARADALRANRGNVQQLITEEEIATALGATPDDRVARFTNGVEQARAFVAQHGCSHKFIDSKTCVKCGWEPHAPTPETAE